MTELCAIEQINPVITGTNAACSAEGKYTGAEFKVNIPQASELHYIVLTVGITVGKGFIPSDSFSDTWLTLGNTNVRYISVPAQAGSEVNETVTINLNVSDQIENLGHDYRLLVTVIPVPVDDSGTPPTQEQIDLALEMFQIFYNSWLNSDPSFLTSWSDHASNNTNLTAAMTTYQHNDFVVEELTQLCTAQNFGNITLSKKPLSCTASLSDHPGTYDPGAFRIDLEANNFKTLIIIGIQQEDATGPIGNGEPNITFATDPTAWNNLTTQGYTGNLNLYYNIIDQNNPYSSNIFSDNTSTLGIILTKHVFVYEVLENPSTYLPLVVSEITGYASTSISQLYTDLEESNLQLSKHKTTLTNPLQPIICAAYDHSVSLVPTDTTCTPDEFDTPYAYDTKASFNLSTTPTILDLHLLVIFQVFEEDLYTGLNSSALSSLPVSCINSFPIAFSC